MILLTGCFVVPSSFTKQPSGKLRPESLVGRDGNAQITLGRTPVEEALIRIVDQVDRLHRVEPGPLWASYTVPNVGGWQTWLVDAERRQIAVHYFLSTGYVVYPLCFAATPKSSERYIVLTIDANGLVTKTDTIEPDVARRNGLHAAATSQDDLMRVLGLHAIDRLKAEHVLPDGFSTTRPTSTP